MAWLRRSPLTPTSQIEIMRSEEAANEVDHGGLFNRPRWQKARQALLDMGADAVPGLIEALEQGFARACQKAKAADALDDASEEAMTADLEAMEDIPEEIVSLLGEIGDPRAVGPLAAVFSGPVTPPHSVQTALGMLHTAEAKVILLGALNGTAVPPSVNRSFAAAGLYHWQPGDPEVVGALLAATDEADPVLAREAIHSLVGLRATEARERLTYLAGAAEDERLREKARDALAELGG